MGKEFFLLKWVKKFIRERQEIVKTHTLQHSMCTRVLKMYAKGDLKNEKSPRLSTKLTNLQEKQSKWWAHLISSLESPLITKNYSKGSKRLTPQKYTELNFIWIIYTH